LVISFAEKSSRFLARLLAVGVLLLGLVSNARADLTNGLVAYYPFDGNASDMSGNGNDGTVNGATLSADRHGIAGKSYSFDGVNDYIEVPYSSDINSPAFSYSIWVQATALNSNIESPVTSRNGSPSSGFMFYKWSDNTWRAQSGPGSGWSTIEGAGVEAGKWMNLTFTYSQGNSSLFHDGVLWDSQPISISINPSKPLRFGAGTTEGTPQFFFNTLHHLVNPSLFPLSLRGGKTPTWQSSGRVGHPLNTSAHPKNFFPHARKVTI
jgi:hypothetical protein